MTGPDTRGSLFAPPRLRQSASEAGQGAGRERHATWMELFYDLVFVVAVAQLAARLKHHLGWADLGGFVLLGVPVWWSWIGLTFYLNRFDPEDAGHRILLGVSMLASAALAVNVADGLGRGSAGFAGAYVASRLVLVLLYWRVARNLDVARSFARRYAVGFTAAAALWAASLAVPPPWRFALWGLGFVVDFGTPLSARALQAELPLDVSHLPERFALFTLIVLGESVVAVCDGLAGRSWDAGSLVAALCAFVLAFSIWWIYFDRIEGTAVRRVRVAGQVWVYAHLPLSMGLAAAGAGVERVLLHDGMADRWLIAGALAVVLLSVAAIHATVEGPLARLAPWRVVGAAACLAVPPLTTRLSAPALMALLAGLAAAQAVLTRLGHGTKRTMP